MSKATKVGIAVIVIAMLIACGGGGQPNFGNQGGGEVKRNKKKIKADYRLPVTKW